MSESCYHCALPIPANTRFTAQVLGAERSFCCPGCQAVARGVVDAGLEDYYAHREAPANRAPSDRDEILERLRVYDHPEIQKSFIQTGDTWREAALVLEEIRCAACLWLNEQQLRRLDGVLDVTLDYAGQQARVRYDPDVVRLSDILATIESIGYRAHPFDPSRRDALLAEQRRRNAERLLFAAILAMPIMAFSIAGYWMGGPDASGTLPLWERIGRFSALLVTTLLLAYSGWDFVSGAARDLKNRRLGMDVPIVLGLGVAWSGSAVATFSLSGEVYFDSIAMFIGFVLLARVIELQGRLRAADQIDRLVRVIPQTARAWRAGDWQEIAVVDLVPGDHIRLNPGEIVPTDGDLLGERVGRFDESILTGESRPVDRRPGEAVVAGSTNIDQPVDLIVRHARNDSMIAEIHGLMRRGMGDRPRYARIADWAASRFVVAVLVVAAGTAGYWLLAAPGQALENTVAVLIVTCPCALALATPVALALSAGRLAETHVLPQRMVGIEPLATATRIVFDKTGTLTVGRPGVADQIALDDTPPETARLIAAALESRSEHPIARAFATETIADLPTVTQLENHPGQGISAWLDGHCWRIGSPSFAAPMTDFGTLAEQHHLDRSQTVGETLVLLSRDGQPAAAFRLADQLRDGVVETLASLQGGDTLRMSILSGDRQVAVDAIASRLEIEDAQGQLSPEDKLDRVREWQRQGEQVIMVGDGINDAPTLRQADVSISFAEATDLARQSADFVVTRSDFHAVAEARRLARDTRRIIRQNLTWAASYNFLAVPFAAMGYVPPWAAAIGMSASSLLVVGNALRLRQPTRETTLSAPAAVAATTEPTTEAP
ncbi:MAG: heavy metal translocating P-type ATPase [Guyparkeria sp.]